jgi:hypothetical protein
VNGLLKRGKGSMFFSKEKNQKTFTSCAGGTIEASLIKGERRKKVKFFASFFQKRRLSSLFATEQR